MPSIEEAQALTGLSSHEDSARFFLDRGVSACILTMGEDGAYFADAGGTAFRVPAFDIAVKCSCGCGDAFNAGYAVALSRDFDPETAVRFAQATSALNASGLGSQAGVRSFEHTYDFMRSTATRR
jgi:sugar/nucleoside kinase (ribokinase family)